MTRKARTALAAALAVAAVVALASCGGEDAALLPGETAREITDNLDKVEELSNEGDCAGAESAAQEISEQIEGLQGVDTKLKRALMQGAERLSEVIDECEETAVEAAPPSVPQEAEEPAEEKESKQREKEQKAEEKAREKEEKAQEKEEAEEATGEGPELPPQAEGEAKGHEKEGGPPPAGEAVGPSGGVGAGSPAEEGD
jgi:hypothetical protein